MKLKVNYEINGNKYYDITEMKTPSSNSKSYFDFYVSFKRRDEIKDYYISIIDEDNKVIHREHVKISWNTNPRDTKWLYGITLCGSRVVSEVRYGNRLPSCCNDRRKNYIDVPVRDNMGKPMYDKWGYPITQKQRCSQDDNDTSIKNVSSSKFPKGVLHSLSKIDYNI